MKDDPLAEGDRLAREGERLKAVAAYDEAADGAPITAREKAVDLLLELGQPQEAFERAEQAWQIAPNAPEVLKLMGRVAWRVGAVREALSCLERVPAESSHWGEAQAERIEALLSAGRLEEAVGNARWALNERPEVPALWLAMGHALMALERLEEAEDAYRQTVELLPSSGRGLAGIAEVCLRLGRREEAVEAGERAVEASGGGPVQRTVLAHALLAIGRHEEGWRAYEARFDAFTIDPRVGVKPRPFEMPNWDGSNLKDSSILVWGEGSPSDEVRFAALLPALFEQGPEPLILECDPRFEALFQRSFPDAEVLPRRSPLDESLTDRFINWQVAMGGLAHRLKVHHNAYGAITRGYLTPDQDRTHRWRDRWLGGSDGRVIGLAWRHPDAAADRRSVPLGPLLDALSLPGRVLVSLQRGMVQEERDLAADRMLLEPDPDPEDVDDLLARADACDVIVTIDALVAHLALGAGIDTRMLLDFGADARWGGGGAQTPWYPSAKLYWQDPKGKWDRAIAGMRRGIDGG